MPKHPTPKPKLREVVPLWKGPIEDGLTFSLLSKFLVCPDRFYIKTILGLSEDDGFNHTIEFGSLWHEAEEAYANGEDWKAAIDAYTAKLHKSYVSSQEEITKWSTICRLQFPIYLDWWKRHPDELQRKPILAEYPFRVPYVLPSGRTIILRGKFDALYGLKREIYLRENKTKGTIDEQGIQQTVALNLQTMIYQIALRSLVDDIRQGKVSLDECFKPDLLKPLRVIVREGAQVKGTGYNVVRRPLSDLHAIRQRKTETVEQFYQRLAGDIKKDSAKYHYRWKILLHPQDVEDFKLRTFHPLLERLVDWWEWVKCDFANPFRPRTWEEMLLNNRPEEARDIPIETVKQGLKLIGLDGTVTNTIHYRFPFGVYNAIANGMRGDYFRYITTGSRLNLVKVDNLFPELS